MVVSQRTDLRRRGCDRVSTFVPELSRTIVQPTGAPCANATCGHSKSDANASKVAKTNATPNCVNRGGVNHFLLLLNEHLARNGHIPCVT